MDIYIYICIYMCIYIYGYTDMDIHIWTSIYGSTYMDIHIWIFLYGSAYMVMHIWNSIYGYPYMDMHIWNSIIYNTFHLDTTLAPCLTWKGAEVCFLQVIIPKLAEATQIIKHFRIQRLTRPTCLPSGCFATPAAIT